MRPGEHEARWRFISIATVRRKSPGLEEPGLSLETTTRFSSLEEKLSQLRLLADARLVPTRPAVDFSAADRWPTNTREKLRCAL
jgi:hypothetical protein